MQMPGLMVYFDDGGIEIDNLVENVMHLIVNIISRRKLGKSAENLALLGRCI